MSVKVSLCGVLSLIRVDALRRVHNVGFLVETQRCKLACLYNVSSDYLVHLQSYKYLHMLTDISIKLLLVLYLNSVDLYQIVKILIWIYTVLKQ